jgi:hypothetical protein
VISASEAGLPIRAVNMNPLFQADYYYVFEGTRYIYVDYRLIHYPVVEENRSIRRKTTANGFEVDTSA